MHAGRAPKEVEMLRDMGLVIGAVVCLLSGVSRAQGTPGADMQKVHEIWVKEVKVIQDAKARHEAALKALELAGNEEAAADKLYAEARHMDRERWALMKDAKKQEAAVLWASSLWWQNRADTDARRARNFEAQAKRETAVSQDESAAAGRMTAAAAAEPNPAEKSRISAEATSLKSQSDDDAGEAANAQKQAETFEGYAKQCGDKAKELLAKAMQLDPNVGK
jgi:hypothetical protein